MSTKRTHELWVTCPYCGGQFNVHELFFTRFNDLKLFCPHCSREFEKERSPYTSGHG